MKWNKQRMIRYTLVTHLCLFCTEEHSRSNQDKALDLLVRLATKDEGKQWRNDEQIIEAVIEALITVGKKNQEHRQTITNALEAIMHSQNAQHRRVINGLLEGKTPNEIVKSDCALQQDDVSCTLFDCSRQELNLQRTHSIYERNQQILKDYYKKDSFAKVSLLADENDQRHIGSFDFNLEEYEEIVTFQDPRGQSSQGKYNQRENNQQRTMKMKKPLDLKDLFKKRRMHPNRIVEDIQRVLVIGNPGTGKTCLSKRICSDWAIGAWGCEFEHVYLIPIRRLNDHRFGTDINLPIIIQKLIYQGARMQDTNQALYKEIDDNLSESTTLLILDGYDEAGETAKTLVSSSLELGCCLLILSRPHSLQSIRLTINAEVECQKLKKEQLQNFVCKAIEGDQASELLEFLSKNSAIEETCRVAVNAQIITRLWKSTYKAELIKSNCANLAKFYAMTSNYIWDRFVERKERVDKDLVFGSLECIAFQTFEKGLVEIPREMVMELAIHRVKVFQDSGFLLFVEEGSVFQFAHLTFHEYFAGCRLAKMLKSNDENERHEAEEFISQHKYIESTRVMLLFMIQHFCMRKTGKRSLEAFKDLMQVFESDPLPTISLQHLLLRMRTLDAFLPCGLDETKVHTNDDVMLIVNDAMDALKRWFGYELDGDDIRRNVLIEEDELRTPIVDELERMPSLFNRFPDLLKPILLNYEAKSKLEYEYRLDIARIAKLNPQYVRQCIVPLLDNWTMEEQACMIQLCTLIGPLCAQPTLDHLKKLLEDQDYDTQEMAIRSLVKFLELFPEREDVRQLVVNASRHPNRHVRITLVYKLGYITFAPADEAGTFVWDLLNEAMKGDDRDVRESALGSCVRLYQTCGKSVDEVMEFIRKFMVSSKFNNDLGHVAVAIENVIQKAPEKEEELLALMKEICRDVNKDVRHSAVHSLMRIIKRSCLKREVLFNVAFDVFKDGYPHVQLNLLPVLFSFDKKEEDCIDEVNEWIANCQDLDEKVREKANSCREANTLLSNYTIEEIHEKFYDQDVEVQMEVVTQFDLREIESNKAASAIAEMATHCMKYNRQFGPSECLLDKLSKTELFPWVVLEKLAANRATRIDARDQPLSHLLEYYWGTKDSITKGHIAKKLLFSSVIFEKKGETEMAITFREKGANVKQIAPVEVVQDLLSRCKRFLKEVYWLDFRHDDAFYSDEESESSDEF